MKIRHGFVSNSSSSSFVVAFKQQQPERTDVLVKFGVGSTITMWDETNDTDALVRDTQVQEGVYITAVNLMEIVDKVFEGEGCYYEFLYHTEEGKRLQKMEDKWGNIWHPRNQSEAEQARKRRNRERIQDIIEVKERAMFLQEVQEWIKNHEGQWAFRYSYSDNDGEGALEHGNHWQTADAMCFSHH
jgi:hypothetical protein